MLSSSYHHQLSFPFITPKLSTRTRVRKSLLPPEWQGDNTVYLLHFHEEIGGDDPRGKAQHYVGLVASDDPHDLQKRLYCHRKGYANGSKLTRAFFREGIGFHVGHVWTGVNAQFERIVKDLHDAKSCCEICQDLPFF